MMIQVNMMWLHARDGNDDYNVIENNHTSVELKAVRFGVAKP